MKYIVVGAAYNRNEDKIIMTSSNEKDMKEKLLKVAKFLGKNDGDTRIIENNE